MSSSQDRLIKNKHCNNDLLTNQYQAAVGDRPLNFSLTDASLESSETESDGVGPPKYIECEDQDSNGGVFARWLSLRKPRETRSKRTVIPEFSLHWKPITLRTPILGGFILFSASIIVVLEILSHIGSGNGNANGGGLAFAVDVSRLPTVTTFSYLYLPTILAVCYSMLWSWVDLDAKRLEPWFQLSMENGASAQDSLLLQYPFEFLPFIPITALRRKHWGVVFAGTIMLMVFWIITPLQSAIFNTGSVIRVRPTPMGTSTNLIPIQSQATALNANFLNTAYGISWLSQKLPAFTTAEYALLPFRPTSDVSSMLPTEIWTTTATAFSTNLTCSPAKTTLNELTYTFDNGNGCIVPDVSLPDAHRISQISDPTSATQSSDFMLLYVGYYNNAQVDYSLQNPNCSLEHSNNFLALFASSSSRTAIGVYSNLTALFCYTSYHNTNISVTVNASSHAVVDWSVPDGSTNTDLPKTLFNSSTFEYILGAGVNPTGERSNLPDTSVLEQYPRLKNYSLTWPVSNMVGFAVALNPLRMEDLAQPTALQAAFQMAHQLLFTTAFNTLTWPILSGDVSDIRAGVRQDSPGAIIIVRSISLMVEVAFGVIAILTLCLWYISHHRKSNLEHDPASIASIMSVLQSNNSPSINIDNGGTLTSEDLESVLLRKGFYLQSDSHSHLLLKEIHTPGQAFHQSTAYSTPSEIAVGETFSAVRPIELRVWFGGSLTAVLAISLSMLAFLRMWSSTHQGFSLPTDNPVVLSIIENYAPTAFATFLEPVWVILNRLLCLLLPFEELRKGNAKASATLEVKYTSLPPQLVFFRAMRARHFLLASVCVISVSTNLLAVTLSALLSEGPANFLIPFASFYPLSTQFNGSAIFDVGAPVSYFDHFYVATSNMSGTPLPAWVDQEFFYQPFNLDTSPVNEDGSTALRELRGTTAGFGVAVTCAEMAPNPVGGNNTVQLQVNQDGSSIQFSTSYLVPNGTKISCFYPRSASHTANDTTNDIFPFPGGNLALEVMQTMQPETDIYDGGFCSSIIVAGWVRANTKKGGLSPGANATGNVERDITSTFITCTQALRTAQFDIVVDTTGHIIRSTQIGDFVADIRPYFVGNASEISLIQQSSALIAAGNTGDFEWHNDSFTSDWMNSLLGSVLNSSTLVDPSAPVPNATVVAPLMENLYQKLFAILLGLNTHVFTESQPQTAMTAEALVIEARLFVSPVMLLISMVILALHLMVVVLYYANRPRRFLPRMPTSIGSITAFVSASRALNDFTSGKNKDVDELGHRYGYGRFIGTDGKTHIGIERQRFVVPLKSQNPEFKKRRKWTWARTQDAEKQVRIWI